MTASPTSRLGRLDRWSLAVLASGAALSAALWERLPERIPVHFDLHGVADGFASKPVGAFLLPAIGVGTLALLRLAPRLFGPGWKERSDRSPMAVVALLTSGLMTGLHVVCLGSALHPGEPAGRPLGLVLAAFWLATSLVLPRVRRNPLVGIRTAWSLASDENWARTHRFAGLVGAAGGVVGLLGALAGSLPTVVVGVLGSGLAAAAYSFALSRRALG